VIVAFLAVLAHLNTSIRTVRIEGRLTAAEQAAVERAVAPVLKSGFLAIDLEDVVASVLALSWPRRVSARRDWPYGLHLLVDKETLVARWGEGRALNSAGHIIETLETVDLTLPLISCAHADGARALGVFEMLERPVRDSGLVITQLEENSLGEWQVTLTGGLDVMLGRDGIAPRLERFLAVYRHLEEERVQRIASVDARYANGVAVGWRSLDEESMTSLATRY
jgi:cell division protein FtsQ